MSEQEYRDGLNTWNPITPDTQDTEAQIKKLTQAIINEEAIAAATLRLLEAVKPFRGLNTAGIADYIELQNAAADLRKILEKK